jgi:tRNA threonylcarbamoyladenosine biosynthesis protein TsaB
MSRPPLVLGLDTSHQRGSVSVSRGPEPVAEILFDASDTHSATLMPAVDSVLRSAKTALSDIDLMAVVIGPGSFTGLRIGLATVKAFAAVRGAGVVPVPSLEVLAAAFPFARQPREVAPFFSSRPETLGAVLERHSVSTPLILCGTGALRYGGLLLDLAPRGSVLAGARWAVPSASLCSFLALERAPLSREELFALEPLYVRPPDARLPDTSRLRVRRDGGS